MVATLDRVEDPQAVIADSRMTVVQALRRIDPQHRALALIVLVQAIWFGALAARGWYYHDDFAFLQDSDGVPLDFAYLTAPLNEHLIPGVRASFWLMHHLWPLDYAITIYIRVTLQAIATVLLWILLTRLIGRRRLVLGIVAVYAFSCLLLPSFLWLTTSTTNLPAQVLVLIAYLSHLRFVRTSNKWTALVTGCALAGAVMFWEKTAVNSLLLVPLSLGYLYTGSIRERVAAGWAQRTGWLITAAPLAGFVAYFLLQGLGGQASLPPIGSLLSFWWEMWSQTVAPSAIGGPWGWFSSQDVYFSPSATPLVGVVSAQIIFVLLILTGLYRTGLRSLWAWSLPALSLVIGATLVAAGRFANFGLFGAHFMYYATDLAVPLALGIALALAAPHYLTIQQHADLVAGVRKDRARQIVPQVLRRQRVINSIGMILVLASVAGGAYSSVRFIDRWQQSPARSYVETLTAQIESRETVNLFNSTVTTRVIPFIAKDRYLEKMIALLADPQTRAKVRFNDGASYPLWVTDTGRLVPAVFFVQSQVDTTGSDPFCNLLLPADAQLTLPLVSAVKVGEWFLQVDYFQGKSSTVEITLVDENGNDVVPTTGRKLALQSGLNRTYLQFPSAVPVSVRVRNLSDQSNLCLATVNVGVPFPRK